MVSSEKLPVSIYYEARCPDSIKFITKQFYPAYGKIGSNLDVNFVPYGKATQRQKNGAWFFTCRHGPSECRGHILQACGLAANKIQAQQVDFVHCVTNQVEPMKPSSDEAIKMCSEKLGITSDKIFECAKSEGPALLAKYGDQTRAVKPSFIPTIIFNGVYDLDNQRKATTDFLKTACALFMEKPEGCNA